MSPLVSTNDSLLHQAWIIPLDHTPLHLSPDTVWESSDLIRAEASVFLFFIPSCLLGFAQSKCFPGCHYCKAFQQNWIIAGKEAAVAFLVGLEKSCNWSRLFSVVNKLGRSRFQGMPAGGFVRHTNYGTFFGGEAPQRRHEGLHAPWHLFSFSESPRPHGVLPVQCLAAKIGNGD